MNIQPISASEFALWDELVATSTQGTLFHSSIWLRASHLPFCLYGVFDEKRLVGGFVTCRKSGAGAKSKANHPSFTPYLGLLTIAGSKKRVSNLSRDKKIASLIAEHIKTDFRTIELRFSPEVLDMQPFIWAGYSVGVRYTYLLDVSDLNRVWDDVDLTRRTDIRRLEKSGFTVRPGVELNQFIHVIRTTLERQGVWSPQFPSIIQSYDSSLGAACRRERFGVYDGDGQLVAGVYLVWDHKRSYNILSGYIDPSNGKKYRALPALALWESIKYTRNALGLSQFDFEGSMLPGVEQFFRQFGGQLVPYYTASWIDPKWRPYVKLRALLSDLKHMFQNGKL